MDTLYPVIALFALAAIIGMYLLALVLQRKETPKAVALIHGLFAAVALVLLIIYNSRHPSLVESIVLFIIAALGGLVLITRDLMGKTVPKGLALVHGLIAMTGFVFLLVSTFARS